MADSLQPHGLQHTRPPCPSPSSWSLLTFMSIKSVMPSNRLILCRPLLLPTSGSFLISQFFASGGQSIAVSASTLVLPMNIQDWLPLGWTGWISLQSNGLSKIFSNTTVQKHQFFGTLVIKSYSCSFYPSSLNLLLITQSLEGWETLSEWGRIYSYSKGGFSPPPYIAVFLANIYSGRQVLYTR